MCVCLFPGRTACAAHGTVLLEALAGMLGHEEEEVCGKIVAYTSLDRTDGPITCSN